MLSNLMKLLSSLCDAFLDWFVFLHLNLSSRPALAAENLFLRKQLALYVERKTTPRRATDAVRFILGQLSRFFNGPKRSRLLSPELCLPKILSALQ